jgi:DNA polymerase-3 subunit beta
LPVLSNVKLSTDRGRLKLSATDLEIGINCWVGAKVEEEGATTVPARLFIDLINSLPPERIDMELVVRTQTLNIKCARYEANIKGIDAEEFPPVPTLEEVMARFDVKSFRLEPEALRRMTEQVVFAASTDESRPILTGVLTEFDGSRLTMAAADGFRLSVRSEELSEATEEPQSIIIPARALKELSRISLGEENPIEMSITPSRAQVLFHTSKAELVSQIIEGSFPDYNQIIPKSYLTRTVISTSDFLKATRTASIFARSEANIVRLRIVPGEELTPGYMTIVATSAELGDNVTEIDADVSGEGIEIAFNVKYLIDVLSVLGTEKMALETTTPTSPGVIKPIGEEEFVHVVMPMHLGPR